MRNPIRAKKNNTFVTLKNHTIAPVREQRINLVIKTRRRASEISLWERAGCQTKSKALEKLIVARLVASALLRNGRPWLCYAMVDPGSATQDL